jgi:SOS-response transcriptional repressor LexA
MSGRKVSNPHVKTFQVIRRYFAEHKQAPTIPEIAELTSMTISTVNRHLLILETEGLLRRANFATRGIELTGMQVKDVVRVKAHEVGTSRKLSRKRIDSYSMNFPPMRKMTNAELERRIRKIVRRASRNAQVVPGEDAVQISTSPLFRNDRLRARKIG